MKEHASMSQAMYFKGIPTKVDVEKLNSVYGVPAEGTEISFEAAADHVGVGVKTYRFRTVFEAWRKMLLREHNILLASIGGGKVKAATPDERIDYSSRKVASGRRAIGKAIVVAYGTDAGRLSQKKAEARASICSMNEAKLRLAAGVMPKG